MSAPLPSTAPESAAPAALSTAPAAGGRGVLFRIGRNAASILVSGAAGEVVASYATALAAVKLGAAGFGAMAATQAFMEPFQSLAIFGLSVVSMTLAARRGGCDGRLLGTLSVLHLVLCTLAAALCLTAAVLTGRLGMVPLLLVLTVNLALIPVSAPSNLPLQYDQAMHRVIAIPAATGLVRLGLAYAAVSYQNTPVGHQIAATAAGAVGTLITWRMSHRFYPRRWQFDGALARELLALAWPAAVLEVVVMVYSRAAYLFLEGAGQRVQGEFAAADRLSRPVLVLAGALVSSSMPSVAKLAATGDRARLWGVYVKVLSRSLLALIPVVAASAWVAPWLLRRFVPEYQSAVRPFQVLLVGVMFMFLNQLSSMFLGGMGKFRLIMAVAMVNLVVYVALASLWVPRYAAVGAALSTSVMEGVNCAQQIAILAFVLRASGEPQKGSRS